jgi:hypothetical protein
MPRLMLKLGAGYYAVMGLRHKPRAASGAKRTTALHVRRDKAALFQWVQGPPGDRSSRKQPGQAWR